MSVEFVLAIWSRRDSDGDWAIIKTFCFLSTEAVIEIISSVFAFDTVWSIPVRTIRLDGDRVLRGSVVNSFASPRREIVEWCTEDFVGKPAIGFSVFLIVRSKKVSSVTKDVNLSIWNIGSPWCIWIPCLFLHDSVPSF